MSTPETTKAPAPLDEAGLAAWRSFLRAHARLIRELDTELQQRHDFALGDFDVLVQLSGAERGRLRMCELASAVMLSPSGLSRRVARLDDAGLVARERGAEDGRNVEARLTAAGTALLERLRETHLAGVEERFADHYSPAELERLGQLLERLGDEE